MVKRIGSETKSVLIFLVNKFILKFFSVSLSLFTFVISPETPNLILGCMIIVILINQFLWFSLVAIFFTQKRVQHLFNKFQGLFNKILGAFLITLGLKIALTEK